ncbi:Transcriptional regulatory protein moc3 [Grifola frondosa]|uniref:Transcriptional regulatory protein moc3 n=1 Tax=Grifola frondosa TaxID=5627 RepID=A0A1C7LZP3_GRIFR|nr:Transcriptional regulatory protein moc3 [Grifola frondosa]
MADSLHYSSPQNHFVPTAYFSQPHTPGHMHVVAASPRQDTTAQRKRPKYTRSKTGCLTCRGKKIKCDETKPNCLRCTHGQRPCVWPDGVPARKKPASRRDVASVDPGLDTRPSTAGSSGISDSSTPPTPGPSAPKREPVELGLPPTLSRRQSEPSVGMPAINNDLRRQSLVPAISGQTHGYPGAHSNTHLLPAIPEIASSYSAHQYLPGYSSNSHHYSQSHSLSRVGSHHDQDVHMRSVDAQWSSPQMLTQVDPIEPFIRHYCHNALSFIMAIPSENPILAANLSFMFDCSSGFDSAVESLRTALLGIAAIHQSYLLSRSGHGGADEGLELASSFRTKSKGLLMTACSTREGVHSDFTLGAALAIALIDIFSGGRDWAKNLNIAKTLVRVRGGPTALLARSSPPNPNYPSGVRRARLFLEILAVYELFGCFARGQEPTLLSPVASSWWIQETNAADSLLYVEKVFGMSREFILILAEVTSYLARTLHDTAGNDAPLTSTPANTDEARQLYNVLEESSRSSDNLPPRVQKGNQIYQNAAQIILLRDILKAPPDDTLVQRHANTVLELCLECGQSAVGVDLNWPVIIAGSQMFGSDRPRVLAVFEAFRCVISCISSMTIFDRVHGPVPIITEPNAVMRLKPQNILSSRSGDDWMRKARERTGAR